MDRIVFMLGAQPITLEMLAYSAGAAAILLLAVLALASVKQAHDRAAEADPPKSRLANLRDTVPPAPRLQESPAFEMRMMRDEQAAAIGKTRWIDQQTKVVQVPVERAMQLIAERGLPDWPAVEVKPPAEKPSKTPE